MILREADEELIDQRYSGEEQAALLRFLRLSDPSLFQLAAVEVWTAVEREALLRWLRQHLPERSFHELSLRALPNVSLVDELAAALSELPSAPSPRVLLLADLEELQGDPGAKSSRTFIQLNVQRDLLVRALPLPILLCAHPAALLRLGVEAPDFSDYLAVRIQAREVPTSTLVDRLVEVAVDQATDHRPEALEHAIEAVRLGRELVARSAAYLPELVRSLILLGAVLAQRGRYTEALAVSEEAVGIARELAEKNPDAFQPDLARSLNNLGLVQSGLGQREAAFASAAEMVRIRRELAELYPDAFQPDLARSLNNLQSGLGQREAALASAGEAVRIAGELAEKSPDAFQPGLAMSLNNLGNRQRELGQREAALVSTGEAVRIFRELAEKSPDAFQPDLARSLNNLGNMQLELGQREAALASTEEALDIIVELAEKNPEAFQPDFVRSLTLLDVLRDMGVEAAVQDAPQARARAGR